MLFLRQLPDKQNNQEWAWAIEMCLLLKMYVCVQFSGNNYSEFHCIHELLVSRFTNTNEGAGKLHQELVHVSFDTIDKETVYNQF